MSTILFLLVGSTLTVSGGFIRSVKNTSPERHHKIFVESTNGSGISGSFDLYYEIASGVKIGCRGAIKSGQEEVSELYVEDEEGLHRIGHPEARQRSKLRLLVVPDTRLKFRGGDKSMEQIGLDHFNLWPRECVSGLLRYQIDDLVAEEAHKDAVSGFTKVKTYRVAPYLDKETKLIWWKWNWPSKIFVIDNGDEEDEVNKGEHCNTCAGGSGSLQGGINNDQICTFFNIKVSEGGVVSVEDKPHPIAYDYDEGPTKEFELIDEILGNGDKLIAVQIANDTIRDGLKTVSNTTTKGDSTKLDGHLGSKSGGGSTIPTITITVGGGGGGGGGGGEFSSGGSGGNAMGFSIATVNSNLNNGFYGCNSDHIEFYGPSILGVQDPCGGGGGGYKSSHQFSLPC